MAAAGAVMREATRILSLPPAQRRIALRDSLTARTARCDDDHALGLALNFNAHLVTELREQAERTGRPTLWSA